MKKLAALVLTLFTLTSCIPMPAETDADASQLTVTFVDVGQGDCTVITLPGGKTMMIDSGEKSEAGTVAGFLDDNGINKIDYLVATHPHSDHIGGMSEVVDNYRTDKIFMPKVSHDTNTYKNLLQSIKNKGLKVTAAKAGEYIFDDGNISAQILAPNSAEYESLNNYSVVVKLVYGDTAFLFTGDAEKLSEEEMTERNYDLSADVLKVGHHGSKTSSCDEFLKAVSPEYAVISCDGVSYNHPNKNTVKRILKYVAEDKILKTFEKGNVTFTSNGAKVKLNEK